jgi:hypothetical protein
MNKIGQLIVKLFEVVRFQFMFVTPVKKFDHGCTVILHCRFLKTGLQQEPVPRRLRETSVLGIGVMGHRQDSIPIVHNSPKAADPTTGEAPTNAVIDEEEMATTTDL